MVTRIAHLCLGSTDLERTARFYEQGLGLQRHFDFQRAGKLCGFYLQVAPGNFLEFFRGDCQPSDAAPMRHLCLETDDLDGAIARLRAAGYEVTDKKLGADQSWQAWTADPDGTRIELHHYTPESSQLTRETCVLG